MQQKNPESRCLRQAWGCDVAMLGTYNPDVAKMHFRKDRELRAKADKNGEIWTYGDGWAMAVQL